MRNKTALLTTVPLLSVESQNEPGGHQTTALQKGQEKVENEPRKIFRVGEIFKLGKNRGNSVAFPCKIP